MTALPAAGAPRSRQTRAAGSAASASATTLMPNTPAWLRPHLQPSKTESLTMSDPFLRRRDVEREVGLGRSSIYRMMEAGTFPRPHQIAPQCVRWRSSEIEAWKAGRPAWGARGNS